MRTTEATEEARRVLEICNACRFCAGYCAVFRVMELRRAFTISDLGYMAHLCHNCRNCYYACQYAPPHEFSVNVPRVLSQIRVETYENYAWPRPLARLFRRNGLVVSLALTAAVAFALALSMSLRSSAGHGSAYLEPGAFYTIIPHWVIVVAACATLGFSLASLSVSLIAFWRGTSGPTARGSGPGVLWRALGDVLTLRNLGGGGYGCNDRDESLSRTRRYCHHSLFYGFVLCFASTTVATGYEYLFGWSAPYPFLSLPVALGIGGGIGMIVGAAGLAAVKMTADPIPIARSVAGADYAFLSLLLILAVSGLALLAFRQTAAMGMLLSLHFGVVLSFFLLLPYSKFVHGLYRTAALLQAAMEERGVAARGVRRSSKSGANRTAARSIP